jgi:putative phosphoribosyl transferase
MLFKDRHDAGRQLAGKLARYAGMKDAIILAIPRGGLEIGYELASILKLPLDIVVTKKIPAPYNEELAVGAVAYGKEVILYDELVQMYGIDEDYLKPRVERLNEVIERRYAEYHDAERPTFPDLSGKVVILTDDGIATGYTMLAAIRFIRKQRPAELIVAVPVSAKDTADRIRMEADELVVLHIPLYFAAVGQFYEEFPQVEDEQAKAYLRKANQAHGQG